MGDLPLPSDGLWSLQGWFASPSDEVEEPRLAVAGPEAPLQVVVPVASDVERTGFALQVRDLETGVVTVTDPLFVAAVGGRMIATEVPPVLATAAERDALRAVRGRDAEEAWARAVAVADDLGASDVFGLAALAALADDLDAPAPVASPSLLDRALASAREVALRVADAWTLPVLETEVRSVDPGSTVRAEAVVSEEPRTAGLASVFIAVNRGDLVVDVELGPGVEGPMELYVESEDGAHRVAGSATPGYVSFRTAWEGNLPKEIVIFRLRP